MKLNVCIGSSCHLKGSRLIVEGFQKLIAEKHLESKVELAGTFCLGNCQNGVSVKVDDELFSVQPETCESFFEEHVVAKLGN